MTEAEVGPPEGSEHKIPEDLSAEAQNEHMLRVIALFNKDPFSDAIAQFCQMMNVEQDLESTAHILQSMPGLDPQKVKEYVLAQRDDRMLDQIFKEHDLQMPLIDAMRNVLSKGKMLVGKVKDVTRILRVFKSSFFAKNGAVYESPECVYHHCLSMLFLNTNLHASSVKRKKTSLEYDRECKRVLTAKINSVVNSSNIYESIREEPFDASFFFPEDFAQTIQGSVKKKTKGFMKGWKTGYIALKNYALFWYREAVDATRANIKGVIQLNKVKVVCDYEGANTKLRLLAPKQMDIVKFKEGRPMFKFGVDKMVFEFQDKKMRDTWLQALKEASVLSGFLDEHPPGMVVTVFNEEQRLREQKLARVNR